ncbi:site-2 protease family protein [Virgibacillus kimchii]
MDIFLIIYLLFVVGPLSTILHEAGHAFAAHMVNADRIRLSIGMGKKIYGISFEKFRLSIHQFFFMGGYSSSSRCKQFKSLEMIWITLLGPLTNALFTVIFYFVHFVFPNNYVLLFFLFNAWLTIVNLLPLKIGGKKSDGYKIVQLIRNRK